MAKDDLPVFQNEDVVYFQEEQQKPTRNIPRDSADLNLMTTDTLWGNQYIPEELKEILNQYKVFNEDGSLLGWRKEARWEMLGFYTRDMRLANLSTINGELEYSRYYLDLANDFLRADFHEPFMICLSRVATVLETSQSKNGFLRRRMNTYTQENKSETIEPKKKNFFGMGEKQH